MRIVFLLPGGLFLPVRLSQPQRKGCGHCVFRRSQGFGPFQGLQAEYARVPFANIGGLVKLPEEVSDDQAILVSDIFPTGYFGADIAGIHAGSTVAVFGCGPVGQFAIASAMMLGAGRVLKLSTGWIPVWRWPGIKAPKLSILKKRTPSEQLGTHFRYWCRPSHRCRGN